MSRGSKPRAESLLSPLLSPQESDKLEEMLGRRCTVSSGARREGSRSAALNILISIWGLRVKTGFCAHRTGSI